MKFGVILMAHGSPDSVDEMEEYLNHVMKRRRPTSQIVEELKSRYSLIGGRSPLLEITRAQAKGLEERLGSIPVFVGMRHWHPFFDEVLPEITESGVTDLIAIAMMPHYSTISVGAYMSELETAVSKHSADLKIIEVKSWYRAPRYLSAWRENIKEGLAAFQEDVRPHVSILFTAHSIPEEIIRQGDPYELELFGTVHGILEGIQIQDWHFAYQSASGSAEKWLGPDVDTKLEELSLKGVKHVLVVPVGFVADHVEVLYDLDILHRSKAQSLGIDYRRVKSLNTNLRLLDALAEIVRGCFK